MRSKTAVRVESLIGRGFDDTYIIRGGMIRPKCSQCEALVINGIACHETECPNATHECHGCDATVPARVKYCADCV